MIIHNWKYYREVSQMVKVEVCLMSRYIHASSDGTSAWNQAVKLASKPHEATKTRKLHRRRVAEDTREVEPPGSCSSRPAITVFI